MKKLLVAAITALTFTACIKVDFNETVGGSGNTDTTVIPSTLTGRIDRSLSLPKGRYKLSGFVYVGKGATLEIAAGSVVLADASVKTALIIEQGGKLVADGKADAPIVFTSDKAAGSRREFDWGGISICGYAPTNRPLTPAPITEGGSNRPYGGTDAGDNSGILRYVRIEFAGITAENNSELNGLTLYGVGAGTIIENVQTSFCGDDGFEFFGGTVNAKNLISFASGDDDFDFDFGYNGQIQYAVSLRDKYSDDDDANQIECDNDASGTTATPVTRPILSNFTLIGPYDTTGTGTNGSRHRYGNRWRRSARFEFRNSIILGSKGNAIVLESDNTINDYKSGTSIFRNNLVFSYNAYPVGAPAIAFTTNNQTLLANADFQTAVLGQGNTLLADRNAAQLTDPFNFSAPNFLPKVGSPALTGANFSGMSAYFNTAGTFVGAFGTTNWAQGWASFTPQTNVY
ncbi:hypothetical protein ESA94_14510 [Lacibacter luteus]|uniref:T9SS C-terminal target domain-containing protein n=1 Tax=Lacibacter luteus TaxID=2508719 RepID=A0A4V1M7D3_9BACT|nr:hypothetical protein [Lacibacter luteus]RXK59344.1 hypothetical protein ESA94_14510 [Lacibacter luteus]